MNESMASLQGSSYIPQLPENIKIEYLAEGGANIVYQILRPISLQHEISLQPSEIDYYGTATPPPTEIEDYDSATPNFDEDSISPDTKTGITNTITTTSGKLLRLKKNVQFGLPYSQIARDFHSKIRSLFKPEELVDQFLVRVPPSVIQQCNEKLQHSERMGKRHAIRHGVYLSTDEPLGMLVTDMTNPAATSTRAGAGAQTVTIGEVKPKWLVQSPSAPAGANRCRTCALRDMKAADAGATTATQINTINSDSYTPLGKAVFCPLDLISTNIEDMQRTITTLFTLHHLSSAQISAASKALYQHPTLLKLSALQREHNEVGLHGPVSGSKETSLSMTLRDCSVFVKMPLPNAATATEGIDIRLGDLDLKSAANGKAEYWRSIENRLIHEGWYMGHQPSQAKTEGLCVLSR